MLPCPAFAIGIIPISKTNGATASTDLAIDCKGYDYAWIHVFASTADVVSDTLNVLKLQECDTTVASSFADITGTGGAFKSGTDFTIATNAYTSTTNYNSWAFGVDLRYRKRYLKVLASPQTTMVMAASVSLHKAEQSASTAAKAQVLNQVIS